MHEQSPSAWPSAGLDVDSLRRSGWKPFPFNQFVLKVHSRCNLACDYCYMYETLDQSWRDQPMVMTEQVFALTCSGIADHINQFKVPAVSLVLHGGEPLLASHSRLEFYARHAREKLGPLTELSVGIQTNGMLLDEEYLRIFRRWRITVGVSLDGDREAHDRHRKSRRGQGSYDQVVQGLTRLQRPGYDGLFGGLLCTIDLDNDPQRTYEALLDFDPPAIDFLMPHGNWMSPPPGKIEDQAIAPYAEWLITIFDRWYSAPRLETRIRMFEDIISLLIGGSGGSELLGLAPVQLVVIETDGTLEQVDALKSTYPGATQLLTLETSTTAGMSDRLQRALWDPGVVARQIGSAALSDTCLSCSLKDVCGGGDYVHRYRSDSGFRNPSVYCSDLAALIRHIDGRLTDDLEKAVRV